ncbi:MAG: hypothetical protein ABDH63_00165 [Candidatus Caldarchaeales archaeon]
MKRSDKQGKNSEKRIEEALNQLLVYTRIIAASIVSDNAKKVIDTYEKAVVYNNLDGNRSDLEISKMTGIPRRTVTGWVKKFVENRLAISEGRKERSLFKLEELGINISNLKKNRKTQKLKMKEYSLRDNFSLKGELDEGGKGHEIN